MISDDSYTRRPSSSPLDLAVEMGQRIVDTMPHRPPPDEIADNDSPRPLTKVGTVKIERSGWVRIKGFEADGCSCRQVAVLALSHAIERLSTELTRTLESPGGGRVSVD